MNVYHYIVIAILIIGSITPLFDKRLKPYQKKKLIVANILVVSIMIFLIYKSSI